MYHSCIMWILDKMLRLILPVYGTLFGLFIYNLRINAIWDRARISSVNCQLIYGSINMALSLYIPIKLNFSVFC